ncbi:hypothetical protein ACQ4M4_00445 [Leptolyngbya sp. AN02str]|uniref:hypothetical protein n=1 Tax=Leptolyngbya sp. AN02str TaxID=3423363 RepID=UPI003D31D791
MMYQRLLVSIVLMTVLVLGCAQVSPGKAPGEPTAEPVPIETVPTDPAPIEQTQLGTSVQVALAQEVAIADDSLTLRFDQVLQDSRCPEGTTCVWQGRAELQVSLLQAGQLLGKAQLIYQPGNGQLGVQRIDGYQVKITGLTPRPGLATDDEPVEYTATFIVTQP